ncbi:DUF1638 domain-containing protein [Methanolapillus millepedarum]|uniref:DUF1638 domain-containing protein n=1 Tax=Methanolapillus millepedarum TaxID=3028296 RepID=A0AA96V478_9EURY|nr:hypothetical protein MsAc7_18100 [Methanosarcinaceae archaeon Ac7]
MTKVTLVSCRIFEDELTALLKKESEMRKNENKSLKIILYKTDFIEMLMLKLDSEGIVYEILESNSLPFEADDVIALRLIEFSMESRPNEIKVMVYEAVKAVQSGSDGILVLYGLCGNVLGNIESDLSLPGCPVRILKDSDGDIVDDCICASLGSRKRYIQVLRECPSGEGTFFLTPMQAAYWREIAYASALTPDPNDDEMIRFVFKYSNYKNVGKINTGFIYEKKYDDIVSDFSSRFDMKIIEYEGKSIVYTCYENLMKELNILSS